jgi:hypothetical protein
MLLYPVVTYHHLTDIINVLGRSLPDGFRQDTELQEAIEIPSIMEKRGKGKRKAEDTRTKTDGDITGYMTNGIFLEWLQRFQQSIVSKNPERKILLLMDNAGCHTKAIKGNAHLFRNINILFLPPNSTSVTQPLDAGVIAVFKMRYRQIIGDKTILLRLRNDQGDATRTNRSRGGARNPWNIKVSNLEAWKSIVRAWGYVKPESIRNCFSHVPILCNRQKDLLRGYNGAVETVTFDPCIHEAIVSRRDVDDLIESQDGLNVEGALEVPFQYVQMPPTLNATSSREERSEWFRVAEERRQLYKDAMQPMIRQANEVLEHARDIRFRAEQVIGTLAEHVPGTPAEQISETPAEQVSETSSESSAETPADQVSEMPSEQIHEPRYSLRKIPFAVDCQTSNVSDFKRDRVTALARILDGSPLLCQLVKEHSGDETFMSYFKAAPEGTVTLGHEWLTSDNDTSDDDYSASSDDDSSSMDGIDCTAEELGSEDEANGLCDVSMEDISEVHSVLMHAAQIVPREYSDLKEQLEIVADAGLGPDFFDADDTYVSRFQEEQRKHEDLRKQRLIHDAKIKALYPEVRFPVMVLGTAVCQEEGMEM